MSNPIVLENEKQGNPESEWGLSQGADSNIEGFATSLKYKLGETASSRLTPTPRSTKSISTAWAGTIAMGRGSSVDRPHRLGNAARSLEGASIEHRKSASLLGFRITLSAGFLYEPYLIRRKLAGLLSADHKSWPRIKTGWGGGTPRESKVSFKNLDNVLSCAPKIKTQVADNMPEICHVNSGPVRSHRAFAKTRALVKAGVQMSVKISTSRVPHSRGETWNDDLVAASSSWRPLA